MQKSSMRGKSYWSNAGGSFESDYLEAELIRRDDPNLEPSQVLTINIKTTNCGIDYDVIVRAAPQAGWVRGVWHDRANRASEGRCEARFYEHVDGSIILFGTWWESGQQYEWFTFLK